MALCIDPQLVVSIRQKANQARRSLGFIVYFWRKASTNGNLCDAFQYPINGARWVFCSLKSKHAVVPARQVVSKIEQAMSAKDTSASPTESVVTVRIAVTTEESREQQETDELLNGIGADPLYIRALPVYLAARGKTAERLRGVS